MGLQMQCQAFSHHVLIVEHMVIADSRKAAPAQGGGHCVSVGAAHLKVGNRIARFDEFIARRYHHHGRLAADAHPRHPGRRRHRDLRCAQQSTGFEQKCALPSILAAAMDVAVTARDRRGFQARRAVGEFYLLNRDHAIATDGQNRAGHDLDGVPAPRQLHGRRSSRLQCLDRKPPHALPRRPAVDRNAVHRDAIERRLVPLRIDIFAQGAADTLRQRQ